MNKTVLITGASSGIGKAAAIYFAERGWNVAATMRSPEKETELQKHALIKIFRLDVTDNLSIKSCTAEVFRAFGSVDVLVNNAGYGATGIFEKSAPEDIYNQFNTNVFGLMQMTREMLPHFREKRSGVIINVSSVAGLVTFPMYSVYNSSKWAVEGFTEGLQFELRQLNIRLKLVEPGAIKTEFHGRSMVSFNNQDIGGYGDYDKRVEVFMKKADKMAPGPGVVAKTIYKAAMDNSWKLRYPSGTQARMVSVMRRIVPVTMFRYLTGKLMASGLVR